MNIITTYEYSEVTYEEIKNSSSRMESMKKVIETVLTIEDEYQHMIEVKLKCIRFKNFVGLVQIDDVVIEILPKIFKKDSADGSKLKIYQKILFLANRSQNIKAKNISSINLSNENEIHILDIIINFYLNELYNQLFRGVYKTYVSEQDNLSYVRGTVLVSKNIMTNPIPTKVFCEFDEYTINNLVNQILKSVTKLMQNYTKWSQNKILAEAILQTLNDVSDINVALHHFGKVVYNRNLQSFESALEIAEVFIQKSSFNAASKGSKKTFIYNIDMNQLFERYIYVLLDENIGFEISGMNYKIKEQLAEKHLVYDLDTNRGAQVLKPDISILREKNIEFIIDTKYKLLDARKTRAGASTNDIYQMFGYHHKYNCRKIILLYPKYDLTIAKDYTFYNMEKSLLAIRTIDLTPDFTTAEGEKFLVKELFTILINLMAK